MRTDIQVKEGTGRKLTDQLMQAWQTTTEMKLPLSNLGGLMMPEIRDKKKNELEEKMKRELGSKEKEKKL